MPQIVINITEQQEIKILEAIRYRKDFKICDSFCENGSEEINGIKFREITFSFYTARSVPRDLDRPRNVGAVPKRPMRALPPAGENAPPPPDESGHG